MLGRTAWPSQGATPWSDHTAYCQHYCAKSYSWGNFWLLLFWCNNAAPACITVCCTACCMKRDFTAEAWNSLQTNTGPSCWSQSSSGQLKKSLQIHPLGTRDMPPFVPKVTALLKSVKESIPRALGFSFFWATHKSMLSSAAAFSLVTHCIYC